MLTSDRARLAENLDQVQARAAKLETINRDVSRRLDTAIETIRSVLAEEEGLMAQVNLTVNGRIYRMACEDGEEDHVTQLGDRFDEAINELRGVLGEIGDQRLMVMAGILMTDRLGDAEQKLKKAEQEIQSLKDSRDRHGHADRGAGAEFRRELQSRSQPYRADRRAPAGTSAAAEGV